MGALADELGDVSAELRAGIEEFKVPGASFAVMHGGETHSVAAGVLNVNTGVEVTPDSVFQIGSITKLFTSTLVMQLVDEGLVELDMPLRRYLPEFTVADSAATEAITVRHLLTHTSGIDGDFFQDTGRGDDCVERYLLACSALPQLHAPGDGWSYCNAGFVLLGRLIERLRGRTWDSALKGSLLRPIGAASLVSLPEDALLLRASAGHIALPGGEARAVPLTLLPRSNGPAGATPFGATSDLFAFARMHLNAGEAPGGTAVVSKESVASMQTPQHDFDAPAEPAHWGLGWMLFDWGGERVIGHDGGTVGQYSFFRVLPAKGIAVALLTNGGQATRLYRRMFEHAFSRLAGISLPPLPVATEGFAVEAARYTGTYAKLSSRVEVTESEGRLTATVTTLKSPASVPMPPQVLQLKPIDKRRFLAEGPEGGPPQVMNFDRFGEDGRPMRLNAGRMFVRSS